MGTCCSCEIIRAETAALVGRVCDDVRRLQATMHHVKLDSAATAVHSIRPSPPIEIGFNCTVHRWDECSKDFLGSKGKGTP